MKHLFITIATLLIALSCINDKTFYQIREENKSNNTVKECYQIPLDVALSKLDSFLSSSIDEKSTGTMSGRTYESINVFNREVVSTKGENQIPDAYIVNFDNNSGFAVLGANNRVPDIVAVTDKGHIDPLTFHVNTQDEGYGSFIETLLLTGLEPADDTLGVGNNPSTRHNVCNKLLNTTWSQGTSTGDVYNKYCYRSSNSHAYTGCSTTAASAILTYLGRPTQLIINGTSINWASMKTAANANNLQSTNAKEGVSLVMGYIFNKSTRIALEGSTLITPEQIVDRMIELGYTNVNKISSSSFNNSMINEISRMLGLSRPLFLSAIPSGLDSVNAHSWVVDGAKYSGGNYLLHFNFGWGGDCDGYFSPSCLNPTQAFNSDYDNNQQGNTSSYYDNEYTWHFRLISYDMPTNNYKSLTF